MTPPLRPDLDPLNFRDFLAGVGLTRLVTDLSDGSTVWRMEHGYPVFEVLIDLEAGEFAAKCAAWSKEHGPAFDDGEKQNVQNIDPDTWRAFADVGDELQSSYWAAIGSDGVPHEKGGKTDWSRITASSLEYAQGGGHQHWLGSMATFLDQGSGREGKKAPGHPLGEAEFLRILQGTLARTSSASDAIRTQPRHTICRWDADVEREHATQSIRPASDPLHQDQTANALATVGLTSCPSAPTPRGLSTPTVAGAARGQVDLVWPLWTTPFRTPALEAAMAIGRRSWHGWPIVRGRRYYLGKLPVFPRGVLELASANAAD